MSAVALRSRAIILARSGLRRDALRLIAVYEELDKRRELAALERHQLARLYDVIGEPKKSLDAYRQLIRHGAPTGVILAEAALALCVRKAASDEVVAEAAEYVSRLQQLEPHSFRTALTRARLLEAQGNPHGAVTALKGFLTTLQVASPEELVRELIKQRKPGEAMDALIDAARRQGDAAAKAVSAHIEKLRRGGDEAEATEVLKRYIRAADFVQAIHAEAIRLVAGVFEAMRQHEAAEEMYNRFVASTQQPDASLVLAAYQARRNRIDEALDLCDRAPERCPPDAVARVSVGILRSGKTTREQIERVEKRILDALEKADAATPQAVNLSIALADLRDFQTRYADAIAIYRSLLERNERNVVVLNNLAWLVSFLPVDRESSLRYIDQALQLAGPVATLLDTRAVIQINLKKPGDAVRDLEQALLEVQDNPGIWYHMALAQLRLGSRAEATEAWKRALALGFDPSSLHALERDGYDSLVNALETGNQRASR
jgi:tetratricopeptide (TPR) repeat protein